MVKKVQKKNFSQTKKKSSMPKKKKQIQVKSYEHVDVNKIGCKNKRKEILQFKQYDQKKKKKEQKKERQEYEKNNNIPKQKPQTTDDKRVIDENLIFSDDEELQNEEKFDEFASFFKNDTQHPKILMTTSEKPSKKTFEFLQEIQTSLPNCYYWERKNYTLKEICEYAPTKDYTDVIIFRENRRKVNELIMIHLPHGPTAIFKLTSQTLNKDIYHHGNPTDHYPEIILNNFNTNVGRRLARFFSSLFPQKPEYKGRRVITFHNQRDFIFFRHHRYIFQEEGKKVNMQVFLQQIKEIGPRFTLQLKKLQKGIFDNKFGELEFRATADMYSDRKQFFI